MTKSQIVYIDLKLKKTKKQDARSEKIKSEIIVFSRPKAKSKTETVPLGHLFRGCRPSTKPSYLYSNQYKGKYIF